MSKLAALLDLLTRVFGEDVVGGVAQHLAPRLVVLATGGVYRGGEREKVLVRLLALLVRLCHHLGHGVDHAVRAVGSVHLVCVRYTGVRERGLEGVDLRRHLLDGLVEVAQLRLHVELVPELVDVHRECDVEGLLLGVDDLVRVIHVHLCQVDDIGLGELGVRPLELGRVRERRVRLVRRLGVHGVHVGHVQHRERRVRLFRHLVRQERLGVVHVLVGYVRLCGLGRLVVHE